MSQNQQTQQNQNLFDRIYSDPKQALAAENKVLVVGAVKRKLRSARDNALAASIAAQSSINNELKALDGMNIQKIVDLTAEVEAQGKAVTAIQSAYQQLFGQEMPAPDA